MDEGPTFIWPAWKLGMKQADLTGTLNDQYNTFSWNIQDLEAFQHDVLEISNKAKSPEQFHQLMSLRKIQRLAELNGALESAAFQIAAKPKLIGADKWAYAVQVFRNSSLDSLIAFFASYLPDDVSSRTSSSYSSFDENRSVGSACSADSSPTLFDDADQVDLTDEPLPIIKSGLDHVSDAGFPSSLYDNNTDVSYAPSPASSGQLSYGSDSEQSNDDDDDLMPSQGPETPISSPAPSYSHQDDGDLHAVHENRLYCGRSSPRSTVGVARCASPTIRDEDAEDLPFSQAPDTLDASESETPTPKQNLSNATSYISLKPSSPLSRRPSSPARSVKGRRGRREGSPLEGIQRCTQEPTNRIQKYCCDVRHSRVSTGTIR